MMTPPPTKQVGDPRDQSPGKGDPEEEAEASGNLWVGNLPLDAVDAELTPLFARYGVLDSVSTFPARNYAFVHFKRLDDAKAARDALQGALVRGNPVKIEFARPVRSPFACTSPGFAFVYHRVWRHISRLTRMKKEILSINFFVTSLRF